MGTYFLTYGLDMSLSFGRVKFWILNYQIFLLSLPKENKNKYSIFNMTKSMRCWGHFTWPNCVIYLKINSSLTIKTSYIIEFNFEINNEFLNQKQFRHTKLLNNPHYKTFVINLAGLLKYVDSCVLITIWRTSGYYLNFHKL